MPTVLCPACGAYAALYPSPTLGPGSSMARGVLDIHKPGRAYPRFGSPLPSDAVCPGSGGPAVAPYKGGFAADIRTDNYGAIVLPPVRRTGPPRPRGPDSI